MAAQSIQRIALIGFGEVGGIFGHDFAKQGISVSVYDILFVSKRHRKQMLSKAGACGVTGFDTFKECVRDADLVISAVTASSALDVARKAGKILERSQTFLDINSVSPATKRKAASFVRNAGYVEAGVMAAVSGQRLKVPMLLGGPYAIETSQRLESIGMNAKPVSEEIGVASAIKMCRSIMVKGLEALSVECLFAARCFGTEEAVLDSLAGTYPSLGWKDRLPDYLISRVAEHGRRRAAEMWQVAEALKDIGMEPIMALATASRQEKLADAMAQKKGVFKQPFAWRPLADAVNNSSRKKRKSTR